MALEIGLPVLDIRGRLQSVQDLAAADDEARRAAHELGLSDDRIDQYLPSLSFDAALRELPNSTRKKPSRRESEVNRASSEVFSWLRGERALQLSEFGPERDNEHTVEGLGEGSWWSNQLTSYLQRAQALGVETQAGRQALAKFVATAIGLLESTVRLYGWLPSPGVRIGENVEP